MLCFTLLSTRSAVYGYGGIQLYNVGRAWGATHYHLPTKTIGLQVMPPLSLSTSSSPPDATQQTSSKIAAIYIFQISNLLSPIAPWQLLQAFSNSSSMAPLHAHQMPPRATVHHSNTHEKNVPIVLTSVKLNMSKLECITDKSTRNSIWPSQKAIS